MVVDKRKDGLLIRVLISAEFGDRFKIAIYGSRIVLYR
jgi:hypothetical protein